MPAPLFRRICVAALVALVVPQSVLAQTDFPSKPVRLVVPFPAGGSLDNVGRQLGQKLGEQWSQSVLIDNRPGGAAIIGTSHVAKALPDGYTLLLMANGFVMVPLLMPNAPYDPFKDFVPVTLLARVNQALVAPPGFAPNNVRELIAEAKARPGQLTFASFGNGTSSHLGVELFKQAAGINMTHVPYKGVAPALQDVLGGQVNVFLTNLPEILAHVQAGKLKALAVADEKRAPQLPNVPTFAEQGFPGFNVYSWYGVVAPAGTPAPIVEKLHAAFAQALKAPDVAARMGQQGLTILGLGSEDFRRFMQAEQARYVEPIRISGARIE
jgi:tripartite-type tricarboxylate transporter receptor subunit TctC